LGQYTRENGQRALAGGAGCDFVLARERCSRWGKAAREMQEQGTFGFAEDAVKYAELNKMFS
jgi:hypothetical protein